MAGSGTTMREADVGVLLTVAGWTGGGVVAGMAFQSLRTPAGQGPFPTAHPLDAFFAVVAGCFLVGPLVAGALLWRWRERRVVSTVATLCGLGLLAVLPLMVVVGFLVDHGLALVGILAFVAGWGIALPAAARTAVDRAACDAADPGLVGQTGPRALVRSLLVGADEATADRPAGAVDLDLTDGIASPWVPVATADPSTAWLPAPGRGDRLVGVGARPAGPPVDPTLPPVVLPPVHRP